MSPERRALLSRVYSALEQIPIDARLAWTLRYVEGQKLEQVAEHAAVRWPRPSAASRRRTGVCRRSSTMDERARQFDAARHELTPQWGAARSAQLYAATLQLRRKRELQRACSYAAVTFVATALLGAGLQRLGWPGSTAHGRKSPAAASARASQGHTLRLADGSTAALLGEKSELETIHDMPDRIALKLVSGRAHFDVVPNAERSFVVEAPPYRIRVIGNIFDVDRNGGAVSVEVTRGHVRVEGPAGTVELRAGEHRRFEPARSGQAVPGLTTMHRATLHRVRRQRRCAQHRPQSRPHPSSICTRPNESTSSRHGIARLPRRPRRRPRSTPTGRGSPSSRARASTATRGAA